MLDSVLEAGGCHSEVDGVLIVLAYKLTVDQAAAETVATAHTIHNMDAICGGENCLTVLVEHCCPVIVVCRDAAAQGDGNLLETETFA